MTMLSRSGILDAPDLEHQDVDVPAWGGTVRVRAMTGRERDDLRVVMVDNRDVISVVTANLLAVTLVDENGARLFLPEDVERLRGKDALTLDNLFAVAMRLNKMDKDAVDTAAKNLEAAPSGDSGLN